MSVTEASTVTSNGSNNGGTQAAQQTGSNAAPAHGSQMAALGELICRLNPYTDLPPDPITKLQTGRMEVQTQTALQKNYASAEEQTIACIAIEAEKNYKSTWTFKGQTQNVKAAFRIPYRFQVQDDKGTVKYWQTEYLLIGYAGGDGP